MLLFACADFVRLSSEVISSKETRYVLLFDGYVICDSKTCQWALGWVQWGLKQNQEEQSASASV